MQSRWCLCHCRGEWFLLSSLHECFFFRRFLRHRDDTQNCRMRRESWASHSVKALGSFSFLNSFSCFFFLILFPFLYCIAFCRRYFWQYAILWRILLQRYKKVCFSETFTILKKVKRTYFETRLTVFMAERFSWHTFCCERGRTSRFSFFLSRKTL